jgi:glycerate kinase
VVKRAPEFYVSTRSLLILLAPDSLKGALSATQACAAMQRGAARAAGDKPHRFLNVPLADGGEGTVEAFLTAVGGELKTAQVRGPLGTAVKAHWAKLPDGTAVIEMAQASGLTLLPVQERDALSASSYGTGELIRAALDAGCRKLLIGVGGSASSDGGSGALRALGARFLDTPRR